MVMPEFLGSKNVRKVSVGLLASLSGLSLAGCAGGNKTIKFGVACAPNQILRVVSVKQPSYLYDYQATVGVSCTDEIGNEHSAISVQSGGDKQVNTGVTPLEITVDQSTEMLGISSQSPDISFDLHSAETGDQVSTIDIDNIDGIQSAEIKK